MTCYAMQFARRVHSNTTLKGGDESMEIEYLKKKKKKKTELCTSVPTIFVQAYVISNCISNNDDIKRVWEERPPDNYW